LVCSWNCHRQTEREVRQKSKRTWKY
jgi:hypothetical protein